MPAEHLAAIILCGAVILIFVALRFVPHGSNWISVSANANIKIPEDILFRDDIRELTALVLHRPDQRFTRALKIATKHYPRLSEVVFHKPSLWFVSIHHDDAFKMGIDYWVDDRLNMIFASEEDEAMFVLAFT